MPRKILKEDNKMKKKLALLMAAIMTVAMVPATALAATKLTVAKDISAGVGDDYVFDALVELKNDNAIYNTTDGEFKVQVKLANGKFAKADGVKTYGDYTTDPDEDPADEGAADAYIMNDYRYLMEEEVMVNADGDTDGAGDQVDFGNGFDDNLHKGRPINIKKINVKSDTLAEITLDSFPAGGSVAIPIKAYAVEAGDVTATISSNKIITFTTSGVIATANANDAEIESEGIVTFVEDATERVKKMKPITIAGLYNTAIDTDDHSVTLRLKGNFEFNLNGADFEDKDGTTHTLIEAVSLLNDDGVTVLPASTSDTHEKTSNTNSYVSKDKIVIRFDSQVRDFQVAEMYISGIYLKPTKACDPGDVAKLTVSSKDFDSTTIDVAKMVEEAVTYTVEDKDLPTIWAGKDYNNHDDNYNTLQVSIEENTGDILNTSRKATFTFPDGIEVAGVDYKEKELPEDDFRFEIDENVVTIWNYAKDKRPDKESEKPTDFGIKFLLNAKPTFSGDVEVTLGGEFDDVTLKVATVKAPYTVEAKTTEVLIDYRYVPVNEIVITEADDGLLEKDDVILLAVEKMDFEDAGSYEVTSGDLEVDVEVYDGGNLLEIKVKDDSTEPSTVVISGLELYLDRTLPVGGYALMNIGEWSNDYDHRQNNANNILWENSSTDKADYDPSNEPVVSDPDDCKNDHAKAIFKYKEVICNDSYVEVVTQARDQDDYTTNRKIVLTIGATTMAVGTETITLDTPAYINSENYTQLPLRAVSEAFGATVNWDDASRTVTIMMGQRVVSMTIGSKTMYVNGTPVAMNTAPEITNERTFVPVRDLANALGITKIDWNEASATVTLN